MILQRYYYTVAFVRRAYQPSYCSIAGGLSLFCLHGLPCKTRREEHNAIRRLIQSFLLIDAAAHEAHMREGAFLRRRAEERRQFLTPLPNA